MPISPPISDRKLGICEIIKHGIEIEGKLKIIVAKTEKQYRDKK